MPSTPRPPAPLLSFARHSYLALACLLREDSFEKKGLIDYNIDAFRKALADVFASKHRRHVDGAAGAGAGAGAADASPLS